MAATEALLTWSGFPPRKWKVEEEESVAIIQTRLQAMTVAMQAKDAALEDLQRRLNAALEAAERAQAREAALLRRAEKSEEAEEALASQMAEVEAEAFTRITQANRVLASHVEPDSLLSAQVEDLEGRLQAAEDRAAAMSQRCAVLGEELAEARASESALQRRAEKAEEAEEALAAQMAELEAESFTHITEANKMLAQGRNESIARRQVAELERRLAEAREELEVVNAKLRLAEDKNRSLGEMQAKAVTLKRKQSDASEETVMSLSLEDLAGFVKLKLWNPASLTLPIGKTACS